MAGKETQPTEEIVDIFDAQYQDVLWRRSDTPVIIDGQQPGARCHVCGSPIPDPTYQKQCQACGAGRSHYEKIRIAQHIQTAQVSEPAKQEQPGINYEQAVRSMVSGEKRVSGMDGRHKGGACARLIVTGMDVRVEDMIVLDFCVVSGMDARVSIIVPPSFSDATVSGMDASVEVTRKTWEEIYHLLKA